MFTYCTSDFKILLDLSGRYKKLEKSFIENVKELAKKVHVSYASNEKIDSKEIGLQFNPKNIVEHMYNTVKDKTGLLIISNNANHIKEWVRHGFSTVYLTKDWDLSLSHNFMPDEIWEYDDFNHFIENPKLNMSYVSEVIGFHKETKIKPKLYKLEEDLPFDDDHKIPSVIFTGRYFTFSDSRHYNHPLSRAILGFKNNLYNHPTVVKETLGKVIQTYLEKDPTVSSITFVPPRPNKKSRFIGTEKFVKTDIKLEYDLLRSVTDYKSPKSEHSYEGKRNLLKGNIACQQKVSGHVLLVDDVYTSGATTNECANVLFEAGADKVTILPLAFTQRYDKELHSIPPVISDSSGNEYQISFNKDHDVYWRLEDDKGTYIGGRDFHFINEQYISSHKTRKVEIVEYDRYKQVDAIIFDLDNTLLHTNHLGSFRNSREAVNDKNLLKKEDIILDPSLLLRLQQEGIKVGIVTRSPRAYAESLLSAYNYPYDALVAAWDTFRTKPSPDPLVKCAKKLNVNPERILNIGDQYLDLEAGNNAGMMNLHIDAFISQNALEQVLNYDPDELPL